MDYITWSADPIILSIGAVKFRWYGLFFSGGFIVSYFIMQWIYNSEEKNIADVDRLLWYQIAGTLIGARLVHVIFYEPAFYLAQPIKILYIWQGGLASHGAAIGIILSIYLYQRKITMSSLWVLDRVSIPIAFSAFFIRIGNFFNSEIIGIPSNVPWAIIFTKVDLIPRHPAQLYEAFSYISIFTLLLYLYNKTNIKHKQGALFGTLLFCVFFSRFLIEFIKVKQENYDVDLFFNTGQLLSIPFMIIGLLLLNFSLKKNTNT
ncbi:Prolipoprotein diacylglyceryl transferase [hydrothermal vent metagenome]|uniref:Prolipoprotein diacylglyceryl transferase n=1 Tax=hydrothermal vent metagenome TaxID=652676 RepID=A0A3B1AA26_9ZZZZ